MDNKQLMELKNKVCEAITSARSEIIELGEDIFNHPELGYKEVRTSEIAASKLKELGLDVERGLAITGVKALAGGKNHNAKVCVLGELDAVVSPQHPSADPKTGAAHSCGHNAQTAAMLGAAIGLMRSGVINELDGDVLFLGVPAEEYVELGYRKGLKDGGKIQFFGGKQELIKDGVFDDVDSVIMVHSMAGIPERKAFVDMSFNGFVGKIVTYIGKAAHAGGEPHKGINALNAALIGLSAINTQRETFQDDDHIRVHPIITKGGDLVNIVPEEVIVETYVRGSNMNAILDANVKVNRALKAGAYAVGGECIIDDLPGYLPFKDEENLSKLFAANMANIIGNENIVLTGNLKQIKGEYGKDRLTISDVNLSAEELSKVFSEKLADLAVVDELRGDYLIVKLFKDTNKNQLLSALVDLNLDIQKFSIYEPTLNDIFIQRVGDK